MAKREDRSFGRQRMQEALQTPEKTLPLLSAIIVSNASSTGRGHAGATMDVNTWHVAQPGEKKTFIGGESVENPIAGEVNPVTEKDYERGEKVETEFVGKGEAKPYVSPLSVIQHASRVRALTGGRKNVNVGFWLDPENKKAGSQVDASGEYSKESRNAVFKERPAEVGGFGMEFKRQPSVDAEGNVKRAGSIEGFVPNPHYDAKRDPKSDEYEGNR